jgi:hypothetical protein
MKRELPTKNFDSFKYNSDLEQNKNPTMFKKINKRIICSDDEEDDNHTSTGHSSSSQEWISARDAKSLSLKEREINILKAKESRKALQSSKKAKGHFVTSSVKSPEVKSFDYKSNNSIDYDEAFLNDTPDSNIVFVKEVRKKESNHEWNRSIAEGQDSEAS